MINMKDLSPEVKSSAFFGIAALIFSFLMGIAFGVGIGTVIVRTIFLAGFFAGIGFVIITVFKRFVPELYDALSEFNAKAPDAESGDNSGVDAQAEAAGMQSETGPEITGGDEAAAAKKSAEGKPDKEFTELTDSDFTKLSTNINGDSSKKKLGKHIIANEKIISYEPKIMAQAVQTMMKRDGD